MTTDRAAMKLQEIKRYDLTYRNDFNDVYPANRDEAEDGEYVTHEDHAAIVTALLADRAAMAERLADMTASYDLAVDSVGKLQQEVDSLATPAAQHKGGESVAYDRRFADALNAYNAARIDKTRSTDVCVEFDELVASITAWADARRPAPVATFEGFVDGQPRFALTGEALKVGAVRYAGGDELHRAAQLVLDRYDELRGERTAAAEFEILRAALKGQAK